jgi:predicted acyltransferase
MNDGRNRLDSLDAFRGATIAAMILVNDPGSEDHIYAQLRHASWHGWTFTDTIFPSFLFIVGVAMTFSLARRMEEGADKPRLIGHMVRRAAILFALGLVVNGFPFWLNPDFSLSTFRIPGVLQRIGICYLITGVMFLDSTKRVQALVGLFLLAVYWLLVKLVSVPGYGPGVLEPTGNLLWYIDSIVFGPHTWFYAPAQGFDPEGILSTLPSIATTLMGIFAGYWLRSERSGGKKTLWMLIVGGGMLLAGLAMNQWLPINKNMWTSSFAVFMGGWSLSLLGLFYWIIDVKGRRTWAKPFVIFGLNAIAVYVVAELLWSAIWAISWTGADGTVLTFQEFIFNTIFSPLASQINASLLFSLSYVAIMFLFAWLLYRRRWLIRI